MTAMMIACPMSPVLAIWSPGTVPVRLSPRVRKKIVIRIGMNRLPSFSPSVSMTMPLRTKSIDELERRLTAVGNQLQVARAEPEEQHDNGDREQSNEQDPVQARTACPGTAQPGEEFVDRGTLEILRPYRLL